jgi:hypothetical protein
MIAIFAKTAKIPGVGIIRICISVDSAIIVIFDVNTKISVEDITVSDNSCK